MLTVFSFVLLQQSLEVAVVLLQRNRQTLFGLPEVQVDDISNYADQLQAVLVVLEKRLQLFEVFLAAQKTLNLADNLFQQALQ